MSNATAQQSLVARLLEIVRTAPRWKQVGSVVGAVAFLSSPFVLAFIPTVPQQMLHVAVLWGLAAVGLNLLIWPLRLPSFGHALFFGTSAYVTAVLASNFDVSSFVVLLVAGAILTGVLGVFVGYFVKKFTALSFGLITLAFAQVGFAIVRASDFMGATQGLSVRPGAGRPTIFTLELTSFGYRLILYYVTLVIIALMLAAMWKLYKSPYGRTLFSIGQNRERAKLIGVPVERYIWSAFILSAVYVGVAGALFGMTTQYVQPSAMSFFRSGELLFMVIIGGMSSLVGPFLGGVLLWVMLEQFGFAITYNNFLIGVILLFIVLAYPRGLYVSAQEVDSLRDVVNGGRKMGARAKNAVVDGIKRR